MDWSVVTVIILFSKYRIEDLRRQLVENDYFIFILHCFYLSSQIALNGQIFAVLYTNVYNSHCYFRLFGGCFELFDTIYEHWALSVNMIFICTCCKTGLFLNVLHINFIFVDNVCLLSIYKYVFKIYRK